MSTACRRPYIDSHPPANRPVSLGKHQKPVAYGKGIEPRITRSGHMASRGVEQELINYIKTKQRPAVLGMY